MQSVKWVCTAAGSGVVFGLLAYFQDGKRNVQTSWSQHFEPTVKWDHNWDKRDASSFIRPPKNDSVTDDDKAKEKFLPTATRHLFFVRHGQYRLKGRTDADHKLTPLGKEQAHLTGQRLKGLNYTFETMVQSSMTRAQETASIIREYLPDMPLQTCDLIREGAPIPTEPPCGKWRPEMKQFHEDGARIEAAFRKYFHRAEAEQKTDSYELFVCHANVIRYFICRALQFPPEAWQRFALHNCSITWIAIRPSGRVFVFSIGDSGHISPDKLTTS